MFFCKRICDQDKDCMKCLRNFLNYIEVNYFSDHHFTKVSVSNCGFLNISLKFKINLLYANNHYIDLVRSEENR